jgi:hypothetical protein
MVYHDTIMTHMHFIYYFLSQVNILFLSTRGQLLINGSNKTIPVKRSNNIRSGKRSE